MLKSVIAILALAITAQAMTLKTGTAAACVTDVKADLDDIIGIAKGIAEKNYLQVIQDALDLLKKAPAGTTDCQGVSIQSIDTYIQKNINGPDRACLLGAANIYLDAITIQKDLENKDTAGLIQEAIKLIEDAKTAIVGCNHIITL